METVKKSKSSELHILVLGRTGSGKSTLINAMLGDHLAKQSYAATPTAHNIAEMHHCSVDDTEVTVYDTPGFFDPRISTMEILKQLKRDYPKGFDLIMLCHRIIDRVDETTIQSLENLCKHFIATHKQKNGQPFMVALTFANLFLDFNELAELKYEEAKTEIFKRKQDDFKALFNKISKSCCGIELFNDIPFVVTGTLKQRQLPCTKDWLSDVWKFCQLQCYGNAKPLVNNLRHKLGFEDSINSTLKTTTGLGGLVGMVVGSAIVPGLGTTIKEVPSAKAALTNSMKHYLSTQLELQLKEVSIQQGQEDVDGKADLKALKVNRKSFTDSFYLPSAKVEDFSSDVFKALGF